MKLVQKSRKVGFCVFDGVEMFVILLVVTIMVRQMKMSYLVTSYHGDLSMSSALYRCRDSDNSEHNLIQLEFLNEQHLKKRKRKKQMLLNKALFF